jgi:hypothetical protein
MPRRERERERETAESLEGAVKNLQATALKNDVKCCWGINYYGS